MRMMSLGCLRQSSGFVAALDFLLALVVMVGLHVRAHRPLDSYYQIGWLVVAALVLTALTCAMPLALALILRRGPLCGVCRWAGTVLLIALSALMLVQVV
ncbi:MAG: hypothetical protein ACLP3R_01965 [Candidatus Korobacteraceae bacterium]